MFWVCDSSFPSQLRLSKPWIKGQGGEQKSSFLSLSPRNDIYILLNCFLSYVVVAKVIPTWIMFVNVSLKHHIYITRWICKEVGGWWETKFRTLTPQSFLVCSGYKRTLGRVRQRLWFWAGFRNKSTLSDLNLTREHSPLLTAACSGVCSHTLMQRTEKST